MNFTEVQFRETPEEKQRSEAFSILIKASTTTIQPLSTVHLPSPGLYVQSEITKRLK